MPTSNFWKKAKNILLDKKVALFAMLFTVLFVTKSQSEKWHEWSNSEKTFRPIVRSDGSGYYAYLPQTFIYKDKNFGFIEKTIAKYPDAKMGEFGSYSPSLHGRMNKFFTGVAVCQAPFFLITHYTHSDKYASDGYSLPYQKSVAVGAIAFLLLGLWLSYLVLLYFKISPWVAAFTLTVFALGTPLLYYSVNDPLTAHGYSFAIIALFFYSLIRWTNGKTLIWLLSVAFSLGMIIILRPSNGIAFILFFAMFSSLKEAWRFLLDNLLKKFSHILLAVLLFGLVIMIQILNVHHQLGHWGFNIYGNEGFDNWNKPPFLEVLFGFRKGLFIYAPLCFISLFGFWFFRKKYPATNRFVLLFLFIFIYVTAAWWCWWYGGSLGMRPFIDVTLFFAIGLAFLLQFVRPWLNIMILPFIAFCIYYQFILSIQMDTAILHYANMNKAKYERIFLQTGDRFQWIFHIDDPKRLTAKTKAFSYWNYSDLTKHFIGSPKIKPDDYRIEHMKLNTVFQGKMDSSFMDKKGIRLCSDVSISDDDNLPWIIYDIKIDGQWKESFTDLIGMRIPSLNKPANIESDWIFKKEVFQADSIRIKIHNTHGKTVYERLRFDFY